MTLPQALTLDKYWREYPPAHESLAMLAMAQAGWKPDVPPLSPEENMERLEKMWANGAAMSPADMFMAQTGALPKAGSSGAPVHQFGGVGPFPGANNVKH